MAKHSKRNRRRMHQSGMGGGFSITHRLTKVARKRIRVAELSPAAQGRLKIVELSSKRGIAATMEAFQVSYATESQAQWSGGTSRNGTVRREFWECYGGPLELEPLQQALRDWETAYNTWRPHQALGYQTPYDHLASRDVSHV